MLHDPHVNGACRLRSPAVGLVTALVLAAGIAGAHAATANAATGSPVAVIVVPPFAPAAYAGRGAVGLLVPGSGSTVSRERALASLVRGRVISSLVELDGSPVFELATKPATTTIYVSLPTPGSHHNVVRYPVAIVGSWLPRAAHLGLDADRRARLARRHRADREGDRGG